MFFKDIYLFIRICWCDVWGCRAKTQTRTPFYDALLCDDIRPNYFGPLDRWRLSKWCIWESTRQSIVLKFFAQQMAMMAFDTLHVHALARYNMSKGFDVFICTNNRIETEKCHENIKWKNSTNSVIVKQTINQCSFREKKWETDWWWTNKCKWKFPHIG